jgi:hypothetical protein
MARRHCHCTRRVRYPEFRGSRPCPCGIRRQIEASIFSMATTLAHQLANYTCALRFGDLSKETVHEVKRRVIDSIGCALGAWKEEPCAIARKVASEFSAKNGSTILGTNHKAPPDWAAFASGCCIRYFDYNDTYLSKEPAHPSDNISAALAVAESVGANGRELITAIALAYEVQCRLCDAASIRARGWDHVTYGAFSTALAAARLMKLDPEKTRHAVNIAGVASAAMRQARVGELSHWKGVAFANAARHLLSAPGARWNDWAGADFRRPDGISAATRCFVRQSRREICSAVHKNRAWPRLDDFKNEHQVLAGGVPQPERDRGGARTAERSWRSCDGKIGSHRKS